MESDRLTLDTPVGTKIVCVEPHIAFLNEGDTFTIKKVYYSNILHDLAIIIHNRHVIDQHWRASRFRILRSSQPRKTNFAAWVSRS